MSKGAPDNSEAIALQRESLAQSKTSNAEMLAALKTQNQNARAMKLPKASPPAALPDTSRADMIAQSQEQRRNLMQRSGLMQTRVVPVQPLRTALGGFQFAA